MPTNRKPIRRARRTGVSGMSISPVILDLYKKCRALYDNPAGQIWEEEGGRKRAYLDAGHALHLALGRKPWEARVTDAIGTDEPPPYPPTTAYAQSWASAKAILTALEDAADE